jgi:diphthine synthase
MLYLIGLGLHDEKDISLRAVEVAKKCACYCELYTNKWYGSLDNLSKIIGKKVQLLERYDVEDDLQLLLNTAKQSDVALFVPGDPLAATTHIDIVLQARKLSIEVMVIHNASIFSSIGESGLQLYKFGKTATIPFTKQLEAVRDAIKLNKQAELHTLLLLDLDAAKDRYMEVSEALELLLASKLVSDNDKIVIMSKLGSTEPKISYGEAFKLSKKPFSIPSVIILPGKLHFLERDFLELFK